MKKLSKILLVAMLTLAMAVPAFADMAAPEVGAGTPIETLEGGVAGGEVKSEGELKLPVIKVTIPTSHGFLINPYKLEGAGQIVSAEAEIKNESNVAIELSLKSTAAVIEGEGKTKATLGAVTDKTTTKTVELRLMVGATAGTASDKLPAEGVLITGREKDVKLATLDATNGVAKLKYGGKVVANPVGNPWTDADKIAITSIYSFVPVVETTP